MIFRENRLPADDSHEISCLICYFWKSSKIFNCRLLQIIGGALRANMHTYVNNLIYIFELYTKGHWSSFDLIPSMLFYDEQKPRYDQFTRYTFVRSVSHFVFSGHLENGRILRGHDSFLKVCHVKNIWCKVHVCIIKRSIPSNLLTKQLHYSPIFHHWVGVFCFSFRIQPWHRYCISSDLTVCELYASFICAEQIGNTFCNSRF